jgi:cytochrome c oxidase subunit 2
MSVVPHPIFATRWSRLVPAAALALAVVLVACGADGNDGALPGHGIALDNGCIACHSTNGDAGVGPTWKGLYGSTVALVDGSKVTVDRAFLVGSIVDPNAQVEAGSKVQMPKNTLADADVQQIVDYIISLK